MRIFIIMMLYSFKLLATDWSELEIHQRYRLQQSFQLPQQERSGSLLDFVQGDQLILEEIVHLGHIRVSLFIFDYLNCPGPQLRTTMEIIPVQNSSPVVEIGAQLESNCKLEVFIETRDLRSQSIFK
jgi:hypothetical protein